MPKVILTSPPIDAPAAPGRQVIAAQQFSDEDRRFAVYQRVLIFGAIEKDGTIRLTGFEPRVKHAGGGCADSNRKLFTVRPRLPTGISPDEWEV